MNFFYPLAGLCYGLCVQIQLIPCLLVKHHVLNLNLQHELFFKAS